jgi:hypothetical protein
MNEMSTIHPILFIPKCGCTRLIHEWVRMLACNSKTVISLFLKGLSFIRAGGGDMIEREL